MNFPNLPTGTVTLHIAKTMSAAGIPHSKNRSGPCSGGVQTIVAARQAAPLKSRMYLARRDNFPLVNTHHAIAIPTKKSRSSQLVRKPNKALEGFNRIPTATKDPKHRQMSRSPSVRGRSSAPANTA